VRIGNFINSEHWGRPTAVPWAIVFPDADAQPRHPSQLYEAALEGVLLAVVLGIVARNGGFRRPGLLTGCSPSVMLWQGSRWNFSASPIRR
jgi:phosphatidylglycerol---prolipoprotein diacylglyceryl transferase